MTVFTFPAPPRPDYYGTVDAAYIQNLVEHIDYITETLNSREPLKKNFIDNQKAGDTLVYDGKKWVNYASGTATYGDVAATLTPQTSAAINLFTTTLTADRAVTLTTTNAVDGQYFRIVRSAGGAFNLNVGTGPLKALAASEWCDVHYDATAGAYVLTAYGSL